MPSVSFTVDAMGRQKVAQTFLSATGEIISCTTNIYSGLDLIAEIQNGVRIDRQVDSFGRPQGLSIGQGYAVEYGFDEYGRFGSVTSTANSVVNNWQYSYLPGSHLMASVDHPTYSARKTYEPNRDLITTVSNKFGSTTISAFGYVNDGLGRRTARTDTTPTLTVNNAFGYNLKSEVTSAMMANGNSKYNYDPIGNRVFSSLNALTNTYSANALNQYTVITNSVSSVPLCEIKPSYDLDGNMLTNDVWSYSWDAENRLTAAYSNNTLLVSNTYDHQSRRIAKITTEGTRTFIWDGWNLISEKLLTANVSLSTFYTWGLDLSGTLQGAGGVGGLLAVHRDNTSFFPCFDANGNVTEYVDATGVIRAHYSFDAFGNTISQSGDIEVKFSHRFSTTYYDPETAFYYYGCRYYASEFGRWVSRDPVEEMYSWSVYNFLDNEATDLIDERGLEKSNPGNRVEPHITPRPPTPPPITKGLPPLSPLLPTTPATTVSQGLAGITGVLIDIAVMVTARPVAVMKGINMCWSQRPYATPPPSSTPTISAKPCKCCVISIRKEGTEGLPMYVLKSAIVVDKYCEDLENGGGHGTISATGSENVYLNWR